MNFMLVQQLHSPLPMLNNINISTKDRKEEEDQYNIEETILPFYINNKQLETANNPIYKEQE